MAEAQDHVNEVARRLGHDGTAGGHHCSIERYSRNIAFQIIFTRAAQHGRLAVVWTFDGNRPEKEVNKRRGNICEATLRAASPPQPIDRRDTDVYAYVGFQFDLPAKPDAGFYDRVAKRAEWVRDNFSPSGLVSMR